MVREELPVNEVKQFPLGKRIAAEVLERPANAVHSPAELIDRHPIRPGARRSNDPLQHGVELRLVVHGEPELSLAQFRILERHRRTIHDLIDLDDASRGHPDPAALP
jgi:hypothetical protein